MSKHQSKYNLVEGEDHCPTCQIPLMEKLAADPRLIRKTVRFFCICGYYKDVPITELKENNRDILD